ncbi:MAG: hypothetical protein Q3996_01100 [Candidatus Saccharibacteria bacterium]|nr:hypothetical protein [Candidatus Saccharibacteria bacterium]
MAVPDCRFIKKMAGKREIQPADDLVKEIVHDTNRIVSVCKIDRINSCPERFVIEIGYDDESVANFILIPSSSLILSYSDSDKMARYKIVSSKVPAAILEIISDARPDLDFDFEF